MGYQENFQLGDLIIPNNVFYAPLAGFSDYTFRRIASKYSPGLLFCEMVKMDALVRLREKQIKKYLQFDEKMRPVGAQLLGSRLEYVKDAAQMIEDLGFDVLDFNCGCPVKKVVKDDCGAALLLHPIRLGKILSTLVCSVKIPVTIKVRMGWDEKNINAKQILKIAEDCGAKAITIHARTRAQGYQGRANWDCIKHCKEIANHIKVIGNGDIVDTSTAKEIFSRTNCDGIMIARAALSTPWIAKEIKEDFLGKKQKQKSFAEVIQIILNHFAYLLEEGYPDEVAMQHFRKIGFRYIKSFPGSRNIRHELCQIKKTKEALSFFETLGETICSN